MNPISINTAGLAPSSVPVGNDLSSLAAGLFGTPQNFGAPLAQPQAPAPAPPPQAKGNWLTHLLPTIANVGGWAAGAALAPETGGLSLLLPAATSALGGTAGKAAENLAEGQSIGSGLAGEAGGSLAGGLALGAGGKVLSSLIGKTGLIPRLVQNQFVGRMPSDINPAEIASGLSNYGIGVGTKGLSQVGDIASLVTGKNGALSSGFRQGLSDLENAGARVDLSGVDQQFQEDVGNKLALSDSQKGTILSRAQNALNSLYPGTETVATRGVAGTMGKPVTLPTIGSMTNVSPTAAFDTAQKFEQMASDMYNAARKGTVNREMYQEAGDSYRAVAQTIHSRIDGLTNDANIPLSDELKQSVIDKLAPLQKINPQAYQDLVSQIPQMSSLYELRTPQAFWVRADNAVKASQINQQAGSAISPREILGNMGVLGGGGLGFALGGGPVGALAGAAAGRALESPLASRGAASILSGLSKAGSSNLPAATGSLLGGASGSIFSNLPAEANSSNINAGVNMPPAQQPTQMPTQAPAPGGGASDIGQILGTLALYSPSALSSLMLSPQQRSTSQAAETAMTNLSGLGSLYSQAGGGLGTFGGEVAKLRGKVTGSDIAAFNSTVDSVANNIAMATGLPMDAVKQQLPKLTDKPEAAAQKMQNVQQLLNTALQSSQQTGLTGLGFTGLGGGLSALSGLGQ